MTAGTFSYFVLAFSYLLFGWWCFNLVFFSWLYLGIYHIQWKRNFIVYAGTTIFICWFMTQLFLFDIFMLHIFGVLIFVSLNILDTYSLHFVLHNFKSWNSWVWIYLFLLSLAHKVSFSFVKFYCEFTLISLFISICCET